MTRFHFDIVENGKTIPDEEGMVLSSIQAVQHEAAQTLGDMAREITRTHKTFTRQEMVVEARDADGPVLKATLVFEIAQTVTKTKARHDNSSGFAAQPLKQESGRPRRPT